MKSSSKESAAPISILQESAINQFMDLLTSFHSYCEMNKQKAEIAKIANESKALVRITDEIDRANRKSR
jgi:hypothetical protein